MLETKKRSLFLEDGQCVRDDEVLCGKRVLRTIAETKRPYSLTSQEPAHFFPEGGN